jgi:Holliday junction resolvase RusA-like endonuclease
MGEPEPKGSARGFIRGKRVIITSTNKNLKGWEQAVRYEAQRYVEEHSVPCVDKTQAVLLDLHFYFQKPESTSKRVVLHNKQPDLDKLIRAVGDALAGIVYDNDSRINVVTAAKDFADPGQQTGVVIRFTTVAIKEIR